MLRLLCVAPCCLGARASPLTHTPLAPSLLETHSHSHTPQLERSALLHLGFQALDAFQASHGGRLPEPGSAAEADEVVAKAKEINEAAAEKVRQGRGCLCVLPCAARPLVPRPAAPSSCQRLTPSCATSLSTLNAGGGR